MRSRSFPAIAALVALGLTAGSARASDPVGIYALLDRVEVLDEAGLDLIVRLEGAFALSFRDEAQVAGYSPPAAGYLLLRCPAGREALCRAEWGDLESATARDLCAAFGTRYDSDPKAPARVRPADEPPGPPDLYPIGQGVALVTHGACADLMAFRGLAPVAATGQAVAVPVQGTPRPVKATPALTAETQPMPTEPQAGPAADTATGRPAPIALWGAGALFIAAAWTALARRGRPGRHGPDA